MIRTYVHHSGVTSLVVGIYVHDVRSSTRGVLSVGQSEVACLQVGVSSEVHEEGEHLVQRFDGVVVDGDVQDAAQSPRVLRQT